jgi:hypothetical protein
VGTAEAQEVKKGLPGLSFATGNIQSITFKRLGESMENHRRDEDELSSITAT